MNQMENALSSDELYAMGNEFKFQWFMTFREWYITMRPHFDNTILDKINNSASLKDNERVQVFIDLGQKYKFSVYHLIKILDKKLYSYCINVQSKLKLNIVFDNTH